MKNSSLLNPDYVAVNILILFIIVPLHWSCDCYYAIKFKRNGKEAIPLMARNNILCGWLPKKHAKIK